MFTPRKPVSASLSLLVEVQENMQNTIRFLREKLPLLISSELVKLDESKMDFSCQYETLDDLVSFVNNLKGASEKIKKAQEALYSFAIRRFPEVKNDNLESCPLTTLDNMLNVTLPCLNKYLLSLFDITNIETNLGAPENKLASSVPSLKDLIIEEVIKLNHIQEKHAVLIKQLRINSVFPSKEGNAP